MANDIDKTSPHYKGDFGSIYEVNKKFPTGGVAGDFVAIEGWAHYWNADRATWCVNAERDSYWDELITNIIEKFKLVRGATYMGVASLDTVPAKFIGAKMYYFATVAGTYKNFGDLAVPQGINVLYSDNGSSWVNTTLLEVAQELGVSTKKVVSQKALNDALNLKANQSSVNEALAKKANTADVDAELGKKFDKESVAQESGDSEVLVMSQKSVSDKLSDLFLKIENTGVRTINISEGNIVLNKYITTRGDEGGSYGYFYSKPIAVKKGDKVVYKGVGDGCIAISTSDSTPTFPVTPIVTSINDGNIYTYEYIVEEDGFVVISGLWSGFKSLLIVNGESVCGNITKNESDITTLKASMNKVDGSVKGLEKLNDKLSLSMGLFEIISNSYVEEDGSITQYNGWKRTSYIRCDTAKYVIITSSVKDTKFNAFYDKDKKFISTFFTAYWNDNIKEAGNRNVIKVPDEACYYIVSNTNAGFEGTTIKNSLEYDPISSSRIYDVYIASRDSKYAKFADYVTDGVNDQDMINSIISDSGVNSIYIYGDSTFLLSAPIKVKDNLKIKSNGATFNNIDMITHQIVSSATSGNQVVLDSTEGFRIGMYLYFEDEKGNNDWNVITRIDKTTPPKITLKNNIKNVWDKANNPVVKSANMCFLTDNVQNVEIDDIVIDWNVDNNPIQKYNPWYVQEGITISESKMITIKNCIVKNGGRRGLSTYDSSHILIENSDFYNWKEHGIDLFNSYTDNGNTREYPFLTGIVITNCRCYDNAMAGIQNHRGSGCLINKCELFNNNYGVSAQEYAHDIVVSDCSIHDNKLQQVFARQDSYNISILGCIIVGSVGWEGVEVYNARKVLVCNNQINNNSRAGIALINGKMCKIHGNILSANNKMITKPSETGLYSAQISISDNSDRNAISDNFIHLDAGGSNYGVWEDGSDYNTVYENDFVGMKVESVKLTGSNSSKRNNREYSS